jgi:hypothetical protein
MRRALPVLLLLGAAACAPANEFTLSKLAGPTNMAAIEAAADCNTDTALALARTQSTASESTYRLMSTYAQAAILTDTGRSGEANSLLASAAKDPQLNPNGAAPADFDDGAVALLQAIRDKRQDMTGKQTC